MTTSRVIYFLGHRQWRQVVVWNSVTTNGALIINTFYERHRVAPA